MGNFLYLTSTLHNLKIDMEIANVMTGDGYFLKTDMQHWASLAFSEA